MKRFLYRQWKKAKSFITPIWLACFEDDLMWEGTTLVGKWFIIFGMGLICTMMTIFIIAVLPLLMITYKYDEDLME
jgi:uncharacterized membrane protein